IGFRPARVLMQDFTGVPAVVDLAAMRDGVKKLGADPAKINPLVPVDLIIDHSVVVDYFGNNKAFGKNVTREYEQNQERYNFLKWGQEAFDNFRVVPPGTGICHQVNLEYLGKTVFTKDCHYKMPDGRVKDATLIYPDTVVGTDSHTTMINALAILGWGVGGIEAEAAMLGQPYSMLIPEVIGFKLNGKLRQGITATDLVLTITQMLRQKGVVGKFVEFYGPGLANLTLADRATISNMAPEYGATCGFFPIDQETLRYLLFTGRSTDHVALVEKYARTQGLYRLRAQDDPAFTDTLELDLRKVQPSMAGPKRPEGRQDLKLVKKNFKVALQSEYGKTPAQAKKRYAVPAKNFDIGHGDVVIAAITSCTNTSNPSVLIAAGLLARAARKRGLVSKPWVKTSLAPGSQVVMEYLNQSGLYEDLEYLGFNLVGFGCTTCIGNSGPLPPEISETINDNGLVCASVLSGNRNFEGRISPDVQANYLASPPLVVAYALAGTVSLDVTRDSIGNDTEGKPVYLRELWPSNHEVQEFISKFVTRRMFEAKYADVFKGDERWQAIDAGHEQTYDWDGASTYVQNPPYFEGMELKPAPVQDIVGARILGLFGDKITTDHISPAGSIRLASPAGQYLTDHRVAQVDFNQYGTRRGNHEIMMRGTFANIRIKNFMMRDDNGNVVEGGMTVHQPSGERMSIYDAAMRYKTESVPLVVFAGAEYGNGSSRDWAAKGPKLLGVRAVVAQSFERIHRSNLIGMGVVPFVFEAGTSWTGLGLKGDEKVSIKGLATIKPRERITAEIVSADGKTWQLPLICRIDTLDELDYFRNGGILQYVLRNLAA
ncbi:MAG: aconitate hydratase AcnA, partial [Pseudomonadota bacterium]